MEKYVHLWKVADTDGAVEYVYGPDKMNTGNLTINKITGSIYGKAIEGMDDLESWFLYGMLAYARAEQMFQKKDYPNETFRWT